MADAHITAALRVVVSEAGHAIGVVRFCAPLASAYLFPLSSVTELTAAVVSFHPTTTTFEVAGGLGGIGK